MSFSNTNLSNDGSCRYCNIRYKTIFADLNELEINLLSTVKKCIDYKKGDVGFTENTYPKGIFCIRAGKFKISRIGNDAKEQIVHLAQEGDAMGFRAILGGDKYNCTGTAMEDSTTCFIAKDTFLELVNECPKLSTRIMHLLTDMLKESEIKITVLGQNSVREKVIHSLSLLVDKYGFENDGCTINIALRRQELAEMAGTTRETATRILFDLENDNILKIIGKKIKIINYPQLLMIAHNY